MTFETAASKLAKAEGKKHQASIGDVREILAIICRDVDVVSLINKEFVKYIKRAQKIK